MTRQTLGTDLYAEVTDRIIAEMEQGRLPWVQPLDGAACGCTLPQNAGTGRRYSGINIVILWAAAVAGGHASQRWLTFRQAQALGRCVRKGERGTTVCYADYLADWLEVLREYTRAIFRAASQASKAADHLLAFVPEMAS